MRLSQEAVNMLTAALGYPSQPTITVRPTLINSADRRAGNLLAVKLPNKSKRNTSSTSTIPTFTKIS